MRTWQKALCIFLCIPMLLIGCTGNVKRNTTRNFQNKKQDTTISTRDTRIENETVVVWKNASDYSNEEIPFSPTSYHPIVPFYNVSTSLNNIENSYRFQRLSMEQMDKIIKNGFVVLDPNPKYAHNYMKMYTIYEDNTYENIPSFITVDMALHLYHKFFDETLKLVEKQELFEALKQLTDNMLQKTISLYATVKNSLVKQDVATIMIYFSVANKLINGSYGDIPEDFLMVAEKEIQEIENAKGYRKSPLFGFDINYEQFNVRGHYVGDDVLEPYFKTMMWYGLIGYPFYQEKEDEKYLDYDSIIKSLLITYIAFQERNGMDDIALWDKIYSPTDFFVGQSDDIHIFDLKDLILTVYGEEVVPEDFRDKKYYTQLEKEVDKLREPQIQHRLITGAVNVSTEKQFRFMGQRYTLDGNIMQELMFPIIRPVPTGLDVSAAFGNNKAEELVKKFYLQDLNPEEYENELQKMKNKVNSLSLKDWQSNLYNGWLWVLKSVWTPIKNTEGFPFFMKNQAWENKNIQTGLGSYAELKHDTVLYAKQPVAEMGGGEELEEPYPNYVEPAVEVYDKLLWLVKYSKVNLQKRELLSERGLYALEKLEEIYTLFRDCSVKQLENIPISEEENKALKYIGGAMESIELTLAEEYNQAISSAIISDVAGFTDTEMFLEIGTGFPNEILVAICNEGKVYLARGAVYSYYEFLSDTPLTNQQWHEILGIEKVESGEWQYEQVNKELLLKNAPPQAEWIHSFKSIEKNNVEIVPIEYKLIQ